MTSCNFCSTWCSQFTKVSMETGQALRYFFVHFSHQLNLTCMWTKKQLQFLLHLIFVALVCDHYHHIVGKLVVDISTLLSCAQLEELCFDGWLENTRKISMNGKKWIVAILGKFASQKRRQLTRIFLPTSPSAFIVIIFLYLFNYSDKFPRETMKCFQFLHRSRLVLSNRIWIVAQFCYNLTILYKFSVEFVFESW